MKKIPKKYKKVLILDKKYPNSAFFLKTKSFSVALLKVL